MRPVVTAFAEQMELKLIENDHKGHWAGHNPIALLARLLEEAGELAAAVHMTGLPPKGQAIAIAREAADVANFAMMIADVCGGLKDTDG